MLAVRKVARGVGNIEVLDVPELHAGTDQVVIEVDSAGIRGTDLHIYFDEFETSPPVTMGHEVSGRIVELGSDVAGWKVGDRVTTETYFYTCGYCLNCRRGRRNLCLKRRSIGSKEDGAFAAYLATPACNLHQVPDGLDLQSAALTEPLACTVHGVLETAGVRAGDNVVITGPGPLPLFGAAPDPGRVVRDGNIITGGGVTAGIDFAMALTAELTDPTMALSVQLALEYAPAPPFDAGTPIVHRQTSESGSAL
jgi:L-iditol 2-dehydrogenase